MKVEASIEVVGVPRIEAAREGSGAGFGAVLERVLGEASLGQEVAVEATIDVDVAEAIDGAGVEAIEIEVAPAEVAMPATVATQSTDEIVAIAPGEEDVQSEGCDATDEAEHVEAPVAEAMPDAVEVCEAAASLVAMPPTDAAALPPIATAAPRSAAPRATSTTEPVATTSPSMPPSAAAISIASPPARTTAHASAPMPDAKLDAIAEPVHRTTAAPSPTPGPSSPDADANATTPAPARRSDPRPTASPDAPATALATPERTAILTADEVTPTASSPSTAIEPATIDAAPTSHSLEVLAPAPTHEPMQIASISTPTMTPDPIPSDVEPLAHTEAPEPSRAIEPAMQQRIDRIRTALEQLRPIPDGGVAVDVDLDGFGRIELRVEPVDGGLRVSLGTDEPTALARLESHRAELEAALRNPGDALALDIHAHGRRARTPRPHTRAPSSEPAHAEGPAPVAARRPARGLVDVVA